MDVVVGLIEMADDHDGDDDDARRQLLRFVRLYRFPWPPFLPAPSRGLAFGFAAHAPPLP